MSHSAAPGTPLLEELHPQQLPAPRRHRRNQGEGSGLLLQEDFAWCQTKPFTSGPLLPLEMKALRGKRSFPLSQGPNTQIPALPGPDPAAAGSTALLPAARPRRRNGG